VPHNLVVKIEEYLKKLDGWITSNPKIVEVIKEIESKSNPVII